MENYTTDDGQIVEYYSDFEETFCKFLKGTTPYIVESCFEDGLHTHRLGFVPIEYLTEFYDDGWVVIKHHTRSSIVGVTSDITFNVKDVSTTLVNLRASTILIKFHNGMEYRMEN